MTALKVVVIYFWGARKKLGLFLPNNWCIDCLCCTQKQEIPSYSWFHLGWHYLQNPMSQSIFEKPYFKNQFRIWLHFGGKATAVNSNLFGRFQNFYVNGILILHKYSKSDGVLLSHGHPSSKKGLANTDNLRQCVISNRTVKVCIPSCQTMIAEVRKN